MRVPKPAAKRIAVDDIAVAVAPGIAPCQNAAMRPTIVFDLDGTLVDTLPDLLASLNRVTNDNYTLAEVRPWIGDGAMALVRRAFAARKRPATEADLRTLMADYVEAMSDQSAPYPGAAEALDTLAAAGWHIAVCTNKPEAPARDLLAATGLLRHIVAVGGGDSFSTRKPDPAHLRATLAAAGGDASAALMVGDHQNDILAANGAGVPAIFAAWGYGDDATGAAASAVSFGELTTVAQGIMGGARIG